MSIVTETYQVIAQDPVLTTLLARSVLQGSEDKPAIYEGWGPENARMPYLSYRWEHNPSEFHWAKKRSTIIFDVFVNESDSLKGEAIRDRLELLLIKRTLNGSYNSKPVRFFPGIDFEVTEDEPDVLHYHVEFSADHWRTDLIQEVEDQNR